MNDNINKNISLTGELSEMFYYVSKAEENMKYAKYYSDNMHLNFKAHEIESDMRNIKNGINSLIEKINDLYGMGARFSDKENNAEEE